MKGVFPDMKIPEIITALGGWGLSVRADQLSHPTPEFVEGVYLACLQQVTGITYDSLRDPVSNCISSLQLESEQDLYSPACPNNLILYHLSRFANAAQVADFSARDLHSPEKGRNLTLLSAFINFVKFTEQFCDKFIRDLRDHSENILVERDEIAEELEKIEHEIEAIKAKMTEDEPQCVILRKENEVLRAKMFEIKNSQEGAVGELKKLKAEKAALVRQRESLLEDIANTTDSVQRTQGRIVQSPERIRKRISQMTTDTAEDRRTILAHETKARDLQAKINALITIDKDVRACVEQLNTIEKEVRSLQDAQKSLNDAKDQFDGRSIEKSEFQLQRDRVQKQLTNAHEKLERAQKHAEDKRQASEKTILRLKAEYEQMAIERRDNDKHLEELRTDASNIESEMVNHLKQSEGELNELLGEYWRLRHETDVYMETLANKLNMRVTSG